MFPVLGQFDGLRISTYAGATVLAFGVAISIFVYDNRGAFGGRLTWSVALWVWIGAEVGCRLYWYFQCSPSADFFRCWRLWQCGRVFYGGLIGGIVAAGVYCRAHHIPLWQFLDRASAYVPLGEAIARLGCFSAGCCWGAPTQLPWGVQYPQSCVAIYSQHMRDGLLMPYAQYTFPTHPVQLYSVAAMCGLFVGLLYARKFTLPTGCYAMMYLTCYGAVRFALEFWRGDCPRYFSAGLTLSQMVSAVLAITAPIVLLVLIGSHRLPRADAAAPMRDAL